MPEGERNVFGDTVAHNKDDSVHVAASQSGPTVIINHHKIVRCNKCPKEDTKGAFKFCSRCKPIGRSVAYCSVECQRFDYKEGGPRSHKSTCGKSVAALEAQASQVQQSHRQLDRNQRLQLAWFDSYPRSVFGATVQVEKSAGVYGEQHSCFFDLPEFVEPYFETLDKLKEIRKTAMATQDEASVGIIALYIERAAEYIRGNPVVRVKEEFVGDYAGYWGQYCDVDESVATRCAHIVAEKVGELDPLISSLFEQLKKAKTNSAIPKQLTTAWALPELDALLRTPSAIFSYTSTSSPSSTTVVLLPIFVTSIHNATSSLRHFAFRAIQSRFSDPASVLYFFFGLEAAKLSKVVRKRVLAATEKEYGLPGGFLEKALSGAEGKLSTELFVNLLREVRAAKGPRTERLVAADPSSPVLVQLYT